VTRYAPTRDGTTIIAVTGVGGPDHWRDAHRPCRSGTRISPRNCENVFPNVTIHREVWRRNSVPSRALCVPGNRVATGAGDIPRIIEAWTCRAAHTAMSCSRFSLG
jgi:hypothetical protein